MAPLLPETRAAWASACSFDRRAGLKIRPQVVAPFQRFGHRLVPQLRHGRHQRIAQEERSGVRVERRRVGRAHLQPVVRQRGQGRCGAVGDGQHLGARVAKTLRHFHRPARVAANAEDQQGVLRLNPQQLIGGVHGASTQLVHAGAAHVQVQRQPGGHRGAVDLRQHKNAALALRDARHHGLEGHHVQSVACGGEVVLVV